jgi:hypothetical protein
MVPIRLRVFTTAFLLTILLPCCSAQSLGEVARRERARKQRPPAQKRVITDSDLPARSTSKRSPAATDSFPESASKPGEPKPAEAAKDSKQSAAALEAKIKAQKQKVRELEAHIADVQKRLDAHKSPGGTVTVTMPPVLVQPGGIGFNWGPCATSDAIANNPYKEWCEEPAKLTADLEKSQAELKTEQLTLEALQEQARQQGFGNAFYDPE